MWLIVGLGNPGTQYEWTRHNCGFLVIDELARRTGKPPRLAECQSLTARASIGQQPVLLVKPQTYMNLSGVAVADLKRKYDLAGAEKILLLSDDIALPFGKIRVRPKGSSGGQKGLRSVIEKLGTEEFPRVRIGVAPDHPIKDVSDFVLAEFPRRDRDELMEVTARAADAVEAVLTTGVAEAMSKYN
jgi:PTH1 family peptidyl-tRNA hydrolase